MNRPSLSNLNFKELLMEVKSSLKTIDMNLDILTSRLDLMKQCVDKHESRLDHLENHASNVDDFHADTEEHLLKMDKDLDIIKAKNEDLETRSRLCIIGLPESPTFTKMEDFVENLLCKLFEDALSPVFSAE
ncbi:hypothetical protein NDU88_001279 [Pleurodeles waltl]|uniref:Uncharacterized protein n=1 Tax=Pleurodeles waltl TaxID=8319 RepID=A0AAV7U6F1_PLEWA|nr:hypothetical protein NDU88_001279 [Pleurodeles waltl]